MAIPALPQFPLSSPASFTRVTNEGKAGTAGTQDTSVTRGTILGERKLVHVQKRLSPLISTLLADEELCLRVAKQEDYERDSAPRKATDK